MKKLLLPLLALLLIHPANVYSIDFRSKQMLICIGGVTIATASTIVYGAYKYYYGSCEGEFLDIPESNDPLKDLRTKANDVSMCQWILGPEHYEDLLIEALNNTPEEKITFQDLLLSRMSSYGSYEKLDDLLTKEVTNKTTIDNLIQASKTDHWKDQDYREAYKAIILELLDHLKTNSPPYEEIFKAIDTNLWEDIDTREKLVELLHATEKDTVVLSELILLFTHLYNRTIEPNKKNNGAFFKIVLEQDLSDEQKDDLRSLIVNHLN